MNPLAEEVPDPERDLSLVRLNEPGTLANPFPFYCRLRSIDPVHWDPYTQCWVLTRYDDVAFALKSLSAARTPAPEQLMEMGLSELASFAVLTNNQMIFVDAPAHTRLRRLVAAAFTSTNVKPLRNRIREVAVGLLEQVLDRGEIEVVSEFADPLPGIATAAMLGVPESDHVLLSRFTRDFVEAFGSFQQRTDRTDAALATCREMVTYFRNAVGEHQKTLGSGMISLLASANVGGDRLTEDEVVANCIGLMLGGQETASGAISGGIKILLEHPADLDALRADPQLTSSATEEVFRCEAPVQYTGRLTTEDLELGGREIAAGESVVALIAAANRDPARFDNPEHFQIRRTDNKHLAFGWGLHHCLGAMLARSETQSALNLLSRLPDLHLKTVDPVWKNRLGLRGLTSLHVGFAPCSQTVFDGVE
jgi:pimeloyl-[acyl-carrier protein] synthase